MRDSDRNRLQLLRLLRVHVGIADPAKVLKRDPGAYESVAVEMSRALFDGASAPEAVAVFVSEWGRTEGTKLNRRRMRRLDKSLTAMAPLFHERGLTDRPD